MKKLLILSLIFGFMFSCKSKNDTSKNENDKGYKNQEICSEYNMQKQFADGDGTENSPYRICTVQQLKNIRTNLNSHFSIERNIDFQNQNDFITNRFDVFSGVLDGNDFVISNLILDTKSIFPNMSNSTIKNLVFSNIQVSVNNENDTAIISESANNISAVNIVVRNSSITGLNNIGVFSEINNSSLLNIELTSSSIFGEENVGGIIGIGENNILEYLHNSSSVSGTINTGGIAGNLSSSSISRLLNTGNISGSDSTGGIIGNLKTTSSVNYLYNSGTISSPNGFYVGGIIGESSISSASYIFNKGDIIADTDIGGLFGVILENNSNSFSLTNSFSVNQITVNNDFVGGIIGNFEINDQYDIVINNVYSYVDINSSSDNKGSLIGFVFGDLPNSEDIQSTYVSSEISGSSIFGDDSTLLTTTNMTDVSQANSLTEAGYVSLNNQANNLISISL